MSTYNSPVDVQAATLVRSSNINDLDAATANAFALLPDETLLKQGKVMYAVDTGTANTYLAELPASPVGYVDGLALTFKAGNANTGACTINVNALGIKSIARENGTDLVSGDIVAGQMCTIRYSTTSGKFQLEGTSAPASAAAAALSAAAAAASATTATNGAGTASAKANEAANSAATAVAAQANSTNPTFQNVTVGSGSAKATAWVNGNSTGANAGAAIIAQVAGASIIAIGNKSALLGGTYDGTPTIYGASTISITQPIIVAGAIAAQGELYAQDLTITGNLAKIGNGTSSATVLVNGRNISGAGGSAVIVQNNANPVIGIGNKSALLGGGYDATPILYAPAPIYINQSINVEGAVTTGGNLTPAADNAQDNGAPSKRWRTYYGGTSSINTSDEREKTTIAQLTASEIAAAKDLGKEIGSYKWLESVREKGNDARNHIGLTVQRAMEIMESHGLKPFDYGFICYDKWDEVVTKKQLNPDETVTKSRAHSHQVQKVTVSTEEVQEVQMIDGVPTLVTTSREVKTPVFEDVQVVDCNGYPVFNIIEDQHVPLMHKVPVMETIESQEAYTEPAEPKYETVVTTPAGDRYAFRYDQLNLFIAAGFEARLAALEAA
jgi:hypothetical protein